MQLLRPRAVAGAAVLSLGLLASTLAGAAHASDTGDEPMPGPTVGDRVSSSEVRAAGVSIPSITFPVEGAVSFTDSFGACRGSGCSRTHLGNDLMGEKLQRLLAPNDAEVIWLRDSATPDGSRSNILVLEDDAGWEYWYIHINNDSPGTDDGRNPAKWRFGPGIEVGARVRAGQHVAYMGDSGNAEWSSPHVHFEIRRPDGNGADGRPNGVAVDPYDALRSARRKVLDRTPTTPIVADIDADPEAEVLVFNPGSVPDHRYDAHEELGSFLRRDITVRGSYEPLVGDFDANGYDDIIWYAPGEAADYIWWYGESGSTSQARRILGEYQPLVGDFDANGYDDIIWYAPGEAADYIWWYGESGSTSQARRILGEYQPLVGDFDNNTYDDILWYAPGTTQDYLWSHRRTGYRDQPRQINGSYEPVVGDFDGNEHDDIFWYAPGTANDYTWLHRADQTYRDLSTDHDQTQRVGVGDLDGDGDDELVWLDLYVDDPASVSVFTGDGFEKRASSVTG